VQRDTERLLALPAVLLIVLFGLGGLLTVVQVLLDAFGH